MSTYVFDLESNGLRGEADRLWCLCFMDIKDSVMRTFKLDKDELLDGVSQLYAADHLIGHNIIGFDLPLIKDLYRVRYTGKVTDTVILSKLLNFYRRRPENCPSHYTVMGRDGKVRKKVVGPHSLQAWGVRLGGEQKVKQENWYEWDENMVVRCESDVRLTVKVLEALRGEL